MNNIKKKFENIWYHYKAQILVAIGVIFVVVYSFANQGVENEFDHSIAIISKDNYPSESQVEKMINAFESKYDGSFEVRIYNIEINGYQQDEVIVSKLGIDISNKISEYYFIENLDAFKEATNNLEFKSIKKVENINWLKDLGVDKFWFAIR